MGMEEKEEKEEREREKKKEEGITLLGGGDAPVSGKLSPVTIRWSNITCSLSDKSSKAVSVSLFYNTSSTFCTKQLGFCKKCLVAEKMYEKVSCADSRVGNAKVRGISGGKKKHLSMACELITSPSVIVADEPTTGLDAFQAEKVMETLHQLAQDGLTASRDGPTNKVRARMSIIFGSVFWRMGRSQSSIQDRMGLLQVKLLAENLNFLFSFQGEEKMFPHAFISKTMILTISYELVLENRIFVHLSGFHLFFLPSVAAINTAMASRTKTGGVFPKEHAIVDRECAKGSYALGPYLLSKLLAEIPVGAAFPLLFGTFCTPWLVFIQLFPGSSFSSLPFRAPPTVDFDFEFSLSTNGQENYSSSYESDSAFESNGFVSGEDGFDTASEKLFVTDPDDETLGESRVVEDCAVSRPFVTDPDKETLEITMEEVEEEEEYVDEPLRK
ncbi:hypothetical protein TEA_018355 [Camellia sinensis var. sinensis]|uniref:ABC-2 type transporter transmembrane domain-containing protein n=1 Tax=Camellia sinensis var. sinensis TaxID=542762 RepID=A0A4V3WJV1_CAMSN|nr:hypothetical protein TEA_018355 [Camellia sinensis var. sinensis]